MQASLGRRPEGQDGRVPRATLRRTRPRADVLPEAFAVCREGGRRFLKMRHYDVQLMGGMVLHGGNIAEMVTGEGKTLVATLAAYLNALEGKGVHVVTVNDYLARRDAEWMSPLYNGLGLTVGAIQSDMDAEERQDIYGRDITYGTNNEFGFDYLRDNMKPAREMQAAGPAQLRDHRRGRLDPDRRGPDPAHHLRAPPSTTSASTPRPTGSPASFKKGVHFEVKEKERTCHLNDDGVREAERIAGVESFYTPGNMEWPHLIDNSLKAHHLYRRDRDYVVMNGEIVIVDEFTGRLMTGRQWSDGLHQAVEAKERVKIKEENQTLATITLQNFFKLYNKLSGMTGTAMTEANEFWKVYKLDVIAIPTNRALTRAELRRRHLPDRPREVQGDPRGDPRGPRDRPADPGRDDLDREVRADLRHAPASSGSSTRSSTPSSTRARPRSSPRPGGRGWSRSPPTWRAEGPTSSSAATPNSWPGPTSSIPEGRGRPAALPDPPGSPQGGLGGGRRQVRARDEGRGARGRRGRRAAHHRDRAAREPADRQPAPRAAPVARATPGRRGSSSRSKTT